MNMDTQIQSLIQVLIQREQKIVLYVTGCGCRAMNWFTRYPGSSSFALEGGNFYAMGSLERLLGHKISKFVTAEVAEDMSQEALVRAHAILRQEGGGRYDSCIGIGLTGAIRSASERKGRHHAYLSIHFMQRKYVYHIELDKNGTREDEEEFISFQLYNILVKHILRQPLEPVPQVKVIESVEHLDIFQLLITKPSRFFNILCDANGGIQLNAVLDNSVVLSGSFNPLHQGHQDIAQRTADICKIPRDRVYYELSIVNADKGAICTEEIVRRATQFTGLNLILSTRPLFKDKNIFLTNGAFSIGADTYKRLIDIKYYNNSITERDISFIEFLKNNNKIVVAPRFNEIKGSVESLPDFEVPHLIMKHVVEIKGFRNDISSTSLRLQRAKSLPHNYQVLQ